MVTTRIGQVDGGELLLKDDGTPPIKLYDIVHEAWTNPLPVDMYRLYLSKVCQKCSACEYTAHRNSPNSVAAHVQEYMAQAKAHEAAKPVKNNGEWGNPFGCPGCEATYRTMADWDTHIARFAAHKVKAHRSVHAVLIRRFTSAPMAHRTPPGSGTQVLEAQASGQERSERLARPRRRRGKRGGRQ